MPNDDNDENNVCVVQESNDNMMEPEKGEIKETPGSHFSLANTMLIRPSCMSPVEEQGATLV